MPASERLPTYLTRAIKSGRAITLLADYRPAELAGFSLTVIGLIDRVSFEGILLADDDPSTEFVRLPLPEGACGTVPEIRTDSSDARAIHELWARWHSGVRDGYLRFTRTIATALSLARLDSALQGATMVGDGPSESAPRRQKRRPRTPAGAQRDSPRSASRTGKRRDGK
ncbi:MAG: hypothetical protein ACPHN2_00580 [Sinimarinibacterium flocculans]|uniref:hypothetical protein n=1 Tax=Sinimarinibacterium flocculans TaxID=985250 RepID=UPI0011B5FB36|nr:hypothetical protein [Sinimarinibacterium flocculans]MEC9357471.1 hypothetical protein [Pseudomonadota bacterium]